MAQGPSDTILVAIWITLRIRESKVRNPDRRGLCSLSASCYFITLSMVLSFSTCVCNLLPRSLLECTSWKVFCCALKHSHFGHDPQYFMH